MSFSEHNHVGQGLGVGEVTIDHAGEGDGCDRCGCPDEELCLPSFWQDSGVPPIWPLSWVFDPKNRYLNDNAGLRMFGNMGFQFFDKERKAFMGTAMAWTIFAICATIFGLLSVSSNNQILKYSAWGIASFRYDNGSEQIGQAGIIGLRKFISMTCSNAKSSNFLDWGGCKTEALGWGDLSCKPGDVYMGFPCEALQECRDTNLNSLIGAFMTCATLIFALVGCLTRIRKVADTNFQKVIGCLPDTLGVVTQAQALLLFKTGCFDNMPNYAVSPLSGATTDDNPEVYKVKYYLGVGYLGFIICWAAAVIRVTVHYVTPVPGGGAGCHCVDVQKMVEDVTGLDLDGDGYVGKPRGSSNRTKNMLAARSKRDDNTAPPSVQERAITSEPTSIGAGAKKKKYMRMEAPENGAAKPSGTSLDGHQV